MVTDTHEEFLKPSREHLAMLRSRIAALESEAYQKIERYKVNDPEYANELRLELHRAVEPTLREMEAVLKTITDYYALQPLPPLEKV